MKLQKSLSKSACFQSQKHSSWSEIFPFFGLILRWTCFSLKSEENYPQDFWVVQEISTRKQGRASSNNLYTKPITSVQMTMYSSKIFPVVVFKIASDGEFPLPMGDVYFGLLLPIFISLARFFHNSLHDKVWCSSEEKETKQHLSIQQPKSPEDQYIKHP